MKLRDYQHETINAIQQAWDQCIERPAVVLPTGMGKTVIFAHLAVRSVACGRRVLILVHRDELVSQTMEKLHEVAPDAHIGVVKGARNEWGADYVIASVQTLGRPNRLTQIPREAFYTIIVDECHAAAADSYIRIMHWFGAHLAPEVVRRAYAPATAPEVRPPSLDTDPTRFVGFTATMSRGDSRGLGHVWEEVVYQKDVLFGVRNGFLTDVRGRAITVDGLDLTQVVRKSGDFADASLGEALESSDALKVAAQGYTEHAGTRQGIAFWPTVRVAELAATEFSQQSIASAVILGATPREDRHLIYKRYRERDIQVIHSVGVLTEGFDMPQAEVALMGRATSVHGLYVQMVGRVLRPFPGKREALVLDITGVTGRFPLASVADLSTESVRPKPGQSLMEAEAEGRREKKDRGKLSIAGDRGFDEVNLFHQSQGAWLQTHSGVWFIQTKMRTVFLWPDDEGTAASETGTEKWKVGVTPSNYSARGGQWVRTGLSLEYALAEAEEYAMKMDASIASRKSSWRRKGVPASEAQKTYAQSLGIDATAMTKTQAADAISVHTASVMLDPKGAPRKVNA